MVIPVFSLADHTALTEISRFSVSEPPRRSGSLTHLRVTSHPLSPRLLILFRTLFMLANSLRIGFSRSTVSARAFCTTMSRHAEVSKIGILGTQPASHIVLTFSGAGQMVPLNKSTFNNRVWELLLLRRGMRKWTLYSWTKTPMQSRRVWNS